jgi:hypothetical protein
MQGHHALQVWGVGEACAQHRPRSCRPYAGSPADPAIGLVSHQLGAFAGPFDTAPQTVLARLKLHDPAPRRGEAQRSTLVGGVVLIDRQLVARLERVVDHRLQRRGAIGSTPVDRANFTGRQQVNPIRHAAVGDVEAEHSAMEGFARHRQGCAPTQRQ